LLYYVGVNKEIPNLKHHNLFFDADFGKHSREIYKDIKWPDNPLFYVCAPSKTDNTVAPAGHENIFILIPIAPGIEGDTEALRAQYFEMVMARLEKHTGVDIKNNIIYNRSYCVNDFKSDYNAFKGNAYGLANTLMQTAFLKPRIKHKKMSNLYFTGQLTAPGPGVPPSLISGQVVADHILQNIKANKR
ncbi:MAG: FAD-dependent oxidoreductase, partial [Salibacteraceae bacterium]|nr:FAD-dependent oxidoreductase [Salibacteraceae bacterium]